MHFVGFKLLDLEMISAYELHTFHICSHSNSTFKFHISHNFKTSTRYSAQQTALHILHCVLFFSGSGAASNESLLDDLSSQANRKSSTGDSWGESRLPPSLVQSKSPNKTSPNKSPNKSDSSTNSTPQTSPTKVNLIFFIFDNDPNRTRIRRIYKYFRDYQKYSCEKTYFIPKLFKMM